MGFAAETENHLDNARRKISEKALDLLYLNDVSGGAIFGSEMTHGTLLDSDGGALNISEVSKDSLAHVLLDQVVTRLR